MASVLLSPFANGQQFFDNNGLPLAGGLIYTYQAGSSTPLATYTDNGGVIPNANPIVLDSSGRVPNEVWLFVGFSYKFILTTASNVTIQTLDNIYPILQSAPAVSGTIPSGLIAIWSGSTGSIPSGWQLCDGTAGAPDLRNSFILGAGATYAVGATGGSADSVVVSHTHSVTDPGHHHVYQMLTGSGGQFFGSGGQQSGDRNTTDSTTGISINTAGVSGTNANLPPYYALAFIMKS